MADNTFEIKGSITQEFLAGYNINEVIKTEAEATATHKSGLGVRIKVEGKGGFTDESSADALTQSQGKSGYELKYPSEAEVFWKLPEGFQVGGGVLKPYRGLTLNGIKPLGMDAASALLRTEYLPNGYQNPIGLDSKNSFAGYVSQSNNGDNFAHRIYAAASSDGGSAVLGTKWSGGEVEMLTPYDPENPAANISIGSGVRFGQKDAVQFAVDGSVLLKTGEEKATQQYIEAAFAPWKYTRFAGDLSFVQPEMNFEYTQIGARLFAEQDIIQWKNKDGASGHFSFMTGLTHLVVPGESSEEVVLDDDGENVVATSGTAIIGQADASTTVDETEAATTSTTTKKTITRETIIPFGFRLETPLPVAGAKLNLCGWAGPRFGDNIEGGLTSGNRFAAGASVFLQMNLSAAIGGKKNDRSVA